MNRVKILLFYHIVFEVHHDKNIILSREGMIVLKRGAKKRWLTRYKGPITRG